APVQRATFGGGVQGDGFARAIAARHEARARHAARDQILDDGCGAFFAQDLIRRAFSKPSVLPSTRTDMPPAISNCGKICWLMAANASADSSSLPLGKLIETGLVNKGVPRLAIAGLKSSAPCAAGLPAASHTLRTAVSFFNTAGAKRSLIAASG